MPHESSSWWVELGGMSCERWVVSDKLCDLWDERSCVKWVVLVVRWAEIREMSCVSCEMSVVWDELCELWDELCERTWVKFSERTRSSSTKCHTKAALERVELCEMSWVRWVVWDELCDLWDERSCVRWNVCIVWDNLSEVERERSNSGGEGGEGKEYKPKNKSPTQRCEEKNHNLMSCVMMFKKKLEEESCYRDTMTKTHNKNVHRRPTVWRAQTTHFWRAQTNPEPLQTLSKLEKRCEQSTLCLYTSSITSVFMLHASCCLLCTASFATNALGSIFAQLWSQGFVILRVSIRVRGLHLVF